MNYSKMDKELDMLERVNNTDVWYHGSRGGIEGRIAPKSRVRCDFGPGFYMGNIQNQAKELVMYDSIPSFYSLRLKKPIRPEQFLYLDGKDWIYTVLAFRKKVPEFSKLKIAKEAIRNVERYDYVYGLIADDNMTDLIKSFAAGDITDVVLQNSLELGDLGYQLVPRTQRACDNIEVLSEREISLNEIGEIQKWAALRRNKIQNSLTSVKAMHRRQGRYLDEIIKDEKTKEIELLRKER